METEIELLKRKLETAERQRNYAFSILRGLAQPEIDHYILFDYSKNAWVSWADVIFIEPSLANFNTVYYSFETATAGLKHFFKEIEKCRVAIEEGKRETGILTEELINHYRKESGKIGLAKVVYLAVKDVD